MTNLAMIAERILNQPLMILPDKLLLIASVLGRRIGIDVAELGSGQEAPALPGASRFGGDPAMTGKPFAMSGAVAVIPVLGSLVNRSGFLRAASGITSYENLKFQISAAAKDDAVKAIILDVDSPGGEAVGAFETADVVREAAGIKPVYAIATGLCCSAAYAIASAATKIVTSRSSVIGSIGVVVLHADYSHALHERGVVPTLIHAGKKKVDGTPYKPLTDDVKASLKTEVEKFQSLFVATVAEFRPGLPKKAILAMEAGTFIGADAVAVGLADAVGSFEGVLALLTKAGSSGNRTAVSAHPTLLQLELAGQEVTDAAIARVTAIMTCPAARGLEHVATTLARLPASQISTESAIALLGIQSQRSDGIDMSGRAGNSPYGLFLGEGSDVGSSKSGWNAVLSKRGMTLI